MAVYTKVNDVELIDFMGNFDYGELLSFKGIAEGVENTNYLLNLERGKFILTLFEKRIKREDLPFYLDLMSHLHKSGISCPRPIANKDGEILHELADRPATIISYLDGVSIKQPQPKHCAELGKILAKMHIASASFEKSRENDLSLLGWEELLEKVLSHADEFKEGISRELQDEMEFLKSNWHDDLPKGVIHADLFTDNVFFKGDKVSGVIDFYFACNDFYAYDLAICLNSWCFERDYTFNITKARHMLNVYNSVRKFRDEEIMSLPILARGAALRFLLTRLYDYEHTPKDALVKTKDPNEYYMKLKFHRNIKNAMGYGLEI